MQIQFLGATNTVTGSKFLITSGNRNILVDCGLFQGYKQLRLHNWAPLPIAPSKIDAVILTHAHLDHSGYIPILVRDGFKGKIYCSEATRDLCGLLLPDSGYLLEEEASYANRKGFTKHQPALPLYTEKDAERALPYLTPVDFRKPFDVAGHFRAELFPAGHILGAAIVKLEAEDTSVTFSGDLGRSNDPIMVDPAPIETSDYLLMESTYGNRFHDPADPLELLGRTIRETAARGGVTIIPSFAVGRAQALLYYIHQLKQSGAIPALLPVYLNSPMAVDATTLYRKHNRLHRLSPKECEMIYRDIRVVNSVAESIALDKQRMPMVIVAASGMATGGRVLHHLKSFAPDPRNTILFAGFQAGGTRGAAMLNGVESIKIHGQYTPLRAQVTQIPNLSAHADRGELMAWLSHFKQPPKRTFLVHGEPDAADSLRQHIEETMDWSCYVPDYLESITLD